MRARDVVCLALVFAVVLAWTLPRPPIGHHGEAREGLVVQDIVQEGRWVLPRRLGEVPSKPPFFHWLAAGGALVLGPSDAVLRLPSGLGAFAMAAATLALGAEIGGPVVGWLAVGALFGIPPFWESAWEARVDMVFSAAVTVAFAGFLVSYRRGGGLARAACWLGAAAAVLAKGPAGAVLVGAVIVVFLVSRREPSRLRALWSWPLAATAAVLALGWYVLAWREGGGDFVGRQLVYENLDRFVGRHEFGEHRRKHDQIRLLIAFATNLLPWNLAVVNAARRWWRGEREDDGGRFLHVWWIVVLALFSLSAGKRNVYLLPLYPAVALLAGRAIARAVAARPDLRVPAAVRRLAPGRPTLALAVAVLLVSDVAVVVATQVSRELKDRRGSLASFADRVRATVPPGEPLVVRGNVAVTDVLVLAYRVGRPVTRARTCTAPGWLVLRADAVDGRTPHALGHRRNGDVLALVRCGPG
jgi:4-amino-4-deoxy-L-arabinose transferase-like glycosyltransferase